MFAQHTLPCSRCQDIASLLFNHHSYSCPQQVGCLPINVRRGHHLCPCVNLNAKCWPCAPSLCGRCPPGTGPGRWAWGRVKNAWPAECCWAGCCQTSPLPTAPRPETPRSPAVAGAPSGGWKKKKSINKKFKTRHSRMPICLEKHEPWRNDNQ